FGLPGQSLNGTDIAVAEDGSTYVVGAIDPPRPTGPVVIITDDVDSFLLKIDPSGGLDPDFGDAGVLVLPLSIYVDEIDRVLMTAEGNLVVVGSAFDAPAFEDGVRHLAHARLDPSGNVLSTFNDGAVLISSGA